MLFFFFFQAEDGIRDHCVTGVQTCALPIYAVGLTGIGGLELTVHCPRSTVHRKRQLRVKLAQRLHQPLTLPRTSQLHDRLIDERLHGAASSSSSATPCACAFRKDSF